MYETVQHKMIENRIKNAEVLNCAAWNKKEELHFIESGSASYTCETGDIAVKGVDIDSVIGNEKVTFIKMDIEGSELKALQGAKNTIIRNRPRLAVCIYHKPMDVIELPMYILKLIPEYRFYIRHYGSNMGEEVLYAVL